MKILMLSCAFPYPPRQGATQLRTFNLMKYLSTRHDVTLVTQRSETMMDAHLYALKEWVEDVVVFPKVATSPVPNKFINKAKQFSSYLQQGVPPHVLANYSPAMGQWVQQAVEAGKFDAVTSEESVNEIYVRPEWQGQLRTVVNVHHSIYNLGKQNLACLSSKQVLRNQLSLPLLRRYEERYCAKFSRVVTTTKEDSRQLKAINPETPISVIPNGVDLGKFPKRRENVDGYNLVFVGRLEHRANIDAVRYLSLEIFPAIRLRYPQATLKIVGSSPTGMVKELGAIEGITLVSNVPDVLDYYHQATVCVIPLRSGSGLQHKTLQAMAAGVPVVASDRGFAGIPIDGADVPLRGMRANTIDEYIYAIGRLFTEPKLREKVRNQARSLIEKEYTWERAGALYEKALTR
jgi:glycosyltransferase involved in cell wall biosynthesis